MERLWTILVVLGLSGCHILTGFDDLTLREDPEPIWSVQFGDSLSQRIDDVVLSPTNLRVAGAFEGVFALSEQPLVSEETTRFLAQFDDGGEHDWSLALSPGIQHHGLIDATGRVTISHQATVTIADLRLEATGGTAFEVVDVAADGASADLVFSGTASELTSVRVAQVPDDAQVLVVGATFEGDLAIGDTLGCDIVMSEDQNIAVARIDARECTWLRGFGDGLRQWIDAIAADRAGNIIVAGRFEGTLDFGKQELVGSGGIDYFVVKLSGEGDVLWTRRYGQTGRNQRPIQLAVQPSGIVTIAGYFDGSLDFGSGTISASLGHDIFVALLDPSGNAVWTRHFPVRNDATAGADDEVLSQLSLEVDHAGNTIIAGHFRASVDFGGTVRSSDGDLDMFLAKLNVDGLLKWSGGFGDGQNQCQFVDCVTTLAVDDSDHIVLGGGFVGGLNLGGDNLLSVGAGDDDAQSDAFLAKFAP